MVDVSRLPAPLTANWDWQRDAACRDIDSTTFFHPDHERGLAKDDRERLAKAICSGCPVIEACRRHALIVREPYGVWGGLTAAERSAFLERSGRSALLAPVTRIARKDPARTASTRPGGEAAEVRAATEPQTGERVVGDAWFQAGPATHHSADS